MAKKSKENDQLSIEGTAEMEILARLTERVEKAVDLIRKLRKEHDALAKSLDEKEKELKASADAKKEAEAELAAAKVRIEELEGESGEGIAELEGELEQLKGERQLIRQRVETVLEKLESLEN